MLILCGRTDQPTPTILEYNARVRFPGETVTLATLEDIKAEDINDDKVIVDIDGSFDRALIEALAKAGRTLVVAVTTSNDILPEISGAVVVEKPFELKDVFAPFGAIAA